MTMHSTTRFKSIWEPCPASWGTGFALTPNSLRFVFKDL